MTQCSSLRLRHTPVRDRVLTFLAAQHLPVTLETVTQAAGLRGHCDPTTVYRTLMLFVDTHLVRQLHFRTRFSYFVLDAPGEHFYYLLCTRCGGLTRVVLSECATTVVNDIGKARGYLGLELELGLFGVCPACQRRAAQETPTTKLLSRTSFRPSASAKATPSLRI